jgi:predicted dehydrogenase
MAIKTGIVGLQSFYWPSACASILKSIPESELSACCDMGYDKDLIKISLGTTPEEFALAYGIKLYHNAKEMIEKEKIQAVCICAKHTEIVNFVELIAPMRVDIYIAKPLATTIESADRIVKAVRNNNIIATSGTTERFDGSIREAYQRYKRGEIGELISIHALHQHGCLDGFPAGDWYWDLKQGGPEFSLIWYAGDIVRWFAGSEAIRVYAEYDNYLTPNSPFMDNGKVIMKFANKVIASIDIYFSVKNFNFPNYEVELVGTEGAIRIQKNVFEGMIFTKEGNKSFYRIQNNMFLDEIRNWLQCCINKIEPELNIEDARNVIELCFACRQSANTHAPVNLPY